MKRVFSLQEFKNKALAMEFTEIFSKLPRQTLADRGTFVSTPRSPSTSDMRHIARTQNDRRFYGVGVGKEVQKRLDSLVQNQPYHLWEEMVGNAELKGTDINELEIIDEPHLPGCKVLKAVGYCREYYFVIRSCKPKPKESN